MQPNHKEKMTPSEIAEMILPWAEALESDIFTNAEAFAQIDCIDSPAQVSDALRYLFTSGQVARKKKDGYKYYYALIGRAPDDFELFDGVAYNKHKFNERKAKKKNDVDVKITLREVHLDECPIHDITGINAIKTTEHEAAALAYTKPEPEFNLTSCCDEHERLDLIAKIVSKRDFAGYLKCLAINELMVSGNREKADRYASFLSDLKGED